MAKDFVDLARELRERYQANKSKFPRGERKNLWLSICQDLFQRHGEEFGYTDIHTFKSDLKKVQIRLSDEDRRIKKAEHFSVFEQDETTSDFGYGEGSTTFTEWQIKTFGLNPESY
ncbi:MAG: hypothetical protein PHT84_04515 [Candidatus Pacebacteria bacterium]|nr:hypothetical protein [Candidatus Paceibacterota bacterium]